MLAFWRLRQRMRRGGKGGQFFSTRPWIRGGVIPWAGAGLAATLAVVAAAGGEESKG
jgi:hypothetical protein